MVNLTLDRNHEIIWLWLIVNPLSANPIKWSNTLAQFVGNMPTNCLSVFGHFEGLALKRLIFCCGSSKIFTMSPNENDPDISADIFREFQRKKRIGSWITQAASRDTLESLLTARFYLPAGTIISLLFIYFQIKLHENDSCIINQNNLWYLLLPHYNFTFKLHTHAHQSKLKQNFHQLRLV